MIVTVAVSARNAISGSQRSSGLPEAKSRSTNIHKFNAGERNLKTRIYRFEPIYIMRHLRPLSQANLDQSKSAA